MSNEDNAIQVEKTEIPRLTCPECGAKIDFIVFSKLDHRGNEVEAAWRSDQCDHVSGREEHLPEELYEPEVVDAVRCDDCQNLVTVTHDNFSGPRATPWIMCPRCNDGTGNSHIGHPVAIQFQGRWFRPDHFLRLAKRTGFLAAVSPRDRLTVGVLNHRALRDEPFFRAVNDKTHAVVKWRNGEAIGYYTSTGRIDATLHQIFVRREFRKQGHGTELLEHFFSSNPKGPVAIESPNNDTMRLLERLGYVTRQNDHYLVKDKERLGFLTLG